MSRLLRIFAAAKINDGSLVVVGGRAESDFRANATCAHQTPTAHGFEDCKKPQSHQSEAYPEMKIGEYDPGDKQDRTQNAAHQPPAKLQVSMKETTHEGYLARTEPFGKDWVWKSGTKFCGGFVLRLEWKLSGGVGLPTRYVHRETTGGAIVNNEPVRRNDVRKGPAEPTKLFHHLASLAQN